LKWDKDAKSARVYLGVAGEIKFIKKNKKKGE
jgi:hypothetical protein